MEHLLLILSPFLVSIYFHFSIVRISVHTVHSIKASKVYRICCMTLTKECKENRSAICGQRLELIGIFTVEK